MRVRLFLCALPLVVAAGLIPSASGAQVTSRNVQLHAHLDEYHTPAAGLPYAYSACWSYLHSDGREYAIIGTSGGTAIYNVTVPSNTYRVGFIPGPPSIWREFKQYRSWIYAVTEGHGAGQGLQIIRMTDPENPVLAATYTSANLVSAHTVTVDTARAILVTNGTRSWAGGDAYPYTGIRVFSIAAPEAPVEVGAWPSSGPYDASNYVHDSVFRGNRLYAASVYVGTERVFDVTNPNSFAPLASWTYPGAFYTHNSWPDSSERYLYITDEQNGQTLRVFDIANLANPILVNGISANPVAIVHNAHVRGGELFLSNYTEGIRLLDLSDPAHPAEYGWADSYPGPSGGYSGVWEVCPFFPSGTVVASDMQTGLYVYRPVRDYGLLRVKVVDGGGAPLPGVRVRLTSQGDSLKTPSDGVVRFAPSPGLHSVTADLFGYVAATAQRTVVTGVADSVTLTLNARSTTAFAGTVRDRQSQAALDGAEVTLAYTTLQSLTDTTGQYQLASVPEDDYRVSVRRPGYVPLSFDRHIGVSTAAQTFQLTTAATWNSLESSTGWTVGAAGDNATAGAWVLAAPVGTGSATGPASAVVMGPASPANLGTPMSVALLARGTSGTSAGCGDFLRSGIAATCATHGGGTAAAAAASEDPPTGHCGCVGVCGCAMQPTAAASNQIKPWNDRTPGAGTRCFITGQATSHTTNGDTWDLDAGKTTLTSPTYDMTGMTDPVIGWWRWFYSRDAGTGQPESNDWLAVLISNDNGTTWVPVDTTRGLHNAWEEQAIHVASYVTPTNQVRVRFIAADLGNATTVEAGIDDVTSYDGVLAAVGVPEASGSGLRFGGISSNPFRSSVSFALELPRAGALAVDVLDVTGRRVKALHRGPAAAGSLHFTWDGRDERGRQASAGVYFAEARQGGENSRIRLIRMP